VILIWFKYMQIAYATPVCATMTYLIGIKLGLVDWASWRNPAIQTTSNYCIIIY